MCNALNVNDLNRNMELILLNYLGYIIACSDLCFYRELGICEAGVLMIEPIGMD